MGDRSLIKFIWKKACSWPLGNFMISVVGCCCTNSTLGAHKMYAYIHTYIHKYIHRCMQTYMWCIHTYTLMAALTLWHGWFIYAGWYILESVMPLFFLDALGVAHSMSCIHVYIHACMHSYMSHILGVSHSMRCMHTCMHACIRSCHIYLASLTQWVVYIHTFIYTYIHTYMHAYEHVTHSWRVSLYKLSSFFSLCLSFLSLSLTKWCILEPLWGGYNLLAP